MSDFDAPEIALPFMFTDDGDCLQIEQDSDQEIQQGVWLLLSYEPGELAVNPGYGIVNQAFSKNGVNIEALKGIIERWDDRALEVIESNPDWFITLTQTITIRRDTDS